MLIVSEGGHLTITYILVPLTSSLRLHLLTYLLSKESLGLIQVCSSFLM